MKSNKGTTPPIQINDTLKVTITAVGKKGDGIAKKDGYTIIVPRAKLNKTYTIKITKALLNYSFSEILHEVKQT